MNSIKIEEVTIKADNCITSTDIVRNISNLAEIRGIG